MHGLISRVCAAMAAGVLLSMAGVTGANASGGALGAVGMSSGMMTDTLAGPGAQLWAERYAGAGNSDGRAQSVAVNPAGTTVYVTGGSGGAAATVAYHG